MNPLLTLLRRPLFLVAGLSFFVNLLLLVPALFMMQVFDRVLSSQSNDTLLVLMLGAGVALLLMLALDYLRSRLQGVAGNLVGESLSPAITRLSMVQGAQRNGRAGAEGLRDVGTLRTLFSAQGLLAVFDAPWLVVYVAIIGLAHPSLGLAAAAAATVMIVLALLNDRLTRRGVNAVQKEASKASRYLETSLASAEVAQTLGMTDSLIARWQVRNAAVSELQRPVAARSVAMAAVTRAFRQSVQVAMLSLGAYLVIHGEATSGVMIATTILLGRALAPVEQLVGSWRVLAEGRGAYRRLGKMLDAAQAEPERMTLPAPAGQLTAQGVVYRVPGSERLILGGVSLHLEPGEALGIIGASGAGKSTLVRLLTGVWKPDAGTVRLDKADLTQWSREQLGPHIGYVPQDVELFPGSVAENIARLGKLDAEAVVRAAQRAHVHDLILALPQGYDTPIEPGSAVISPGQRQRIALARALYGDPKLVILDEPNSNLDGAGEVALASALRELRGHATVIVVTHRSTLIQHVDKLLVLDGGRAKHYGPAAEVTKAMQAAAAPKPSAEARVAEMLRTLSAGANGGATAGAVGTTGAAGGQDKTAAASGDAE